jgi:Tir chaperone protein (CesT) family
VIDVPTLKSWIEALGYEATLEGETTLRIRARGADGSPPSRPSADASPDGPAGGPKPRPPSDALPPFFAQVSENWILLSMLPMLGRGAYRPEDLGRRLLAANRDMRLAKFALDKNGAVVLCAELPTESLDVSEIADAVQRMTEYARHFAAEFIRRK